MEVLYMQKTCEFYGKSGNVDSAMANAIISTSAESVMRIP